MLAIDFGTVRIGTAVCDEMQIVATPFRVLPFSEDAVAEIAAIVREGAIERVVIGMPYTLEGSLSPMTRRTKEFAEQLRAALACPVVEWDESYSSIDAQAGMRSAGVRRKKRREKGTTDTWAAAIILQEYLESLR